MAEYYNKKVKLKRFNIGDLVLWKVTLTKKDPVQGKLGPTWEGPYRVVHYSRQGSYHLEDLDWNRLPHPWNVEDLKRYYEKGIIAWLYNLIFELFNTSHVINNYLEFCKLLFSISRALSNSSRTLIISFSKDQKGRPNRKTIRFLRWMYIVQTKERIRFLKWMYVVQTKKTIRFLKWM